MFSVSLLEDCRSLLMSIKDRSNYCGNKSENINLGCMSEIEKRPEKSKMVQKSLT